MDDLIVEASILFTVIAACSLIKQNVSKVTKRRNRSVWVKKWLLDRNEKGVYYSLLNELKLTDLESFRKYLRMNTATFQVRIIHKPSHKSVTRNYHASNHYRFACTVLTAFGINSCVP